VVDRHHYPFDLYTCEFEPRGAKHWIPLSSEGRIIKSNFKKCYNMKPKCIWVYEQAVLTKLEEYEWPWTKLMYAEGLRPQGRWDEEHKFKPGEHDL